MNENTQQPTDDTPVIATQSENQALTSPDDAPQPDATPTATAQQPEPAAPDNAELQRLLAEAEQRGYMRGRNEAIENLMQAPALFESTAAPTTDSTANPADGFLSGLRPGVWD